MGLLENRIKSVLSCSWGAQAPGSSGQGNGDEAGKEEEWLQRGTYGASYNFIKSTAESLKCVQAGGINYCTSLSLPGGVEFTLQLPLVPCSLTSKARVLQ